MHCTSKLDIAPCQVLCSSRNYPYSTAKGEGSSRGEGSMKSVFSRIWNFCGGSVCVCVCVCGGGGGGGG